jgi:1,2-dihydroxy-3-keto-5-methylthiopentene dioxygenase
MSRLRIFHENEPEQLLYCSDNREQIAMRLRSLGIRFEQWPLDNSITTGAESEQVMHAYQQHIDRLNEEYGFQSMDVISMAPDHSKREELRQKFLQEHTHNEDEIRFFVAGSGLFTMHPHAEVYEVLCSAGDLISVPAGMRHWFDMGPAPDFIAIRFFTRPDGWVGYFTGDDIADRFPRLQPGAGQ